MIEIYEAIIDMNINIINSEVYEGCCLIFSNIGSIESKNRNFDPSKYL